MTRNLRLLLLALLLTLAPAGIGVAATQAAHASPAVEICTNNGSSSLCMNRKGNGQSSGTTIIGYSAGQSNNDFEYVRLSGMCNNGQVEVVGGGGCPFPAGSGLNSKYDGWYINSIESISLDNLCVGTQESSSGGVLTTCPDIDGNNGGWGTIDVTCPAQQGCNVVNYHWTVADGEAEGPCSYTKSNQILFSYALSSSTKQCEWNELYG
jgi:hypothetical protein